jgi:hypothetical protein
MFGAENVQAMRTLFALALLIALPGLGKDKTQYTYQDGVLQAVKRVASGSEYEWDYTVKTGNITYVLTEARRIEGGAGTLTGFVGKFHKSGVLTNQPPGTQLKLRTDPNGIYVKVGQHESLYQMVSAE